MPNNLLLRWTVIAIIALTFPSMLAQQFPSVFLQYQRLPWEQRQIIETAHRNLGYMAQLSPTAERLLDFYQDRAILCRLDDSTLTNCGRRFRGKTFFVYADLKPVFRGNHLVGANANISRNVVVLRDSTVSPNVLAILFAHELEHLANRDAYGDSSANELSVKWLWGEQRSHETVRGMLNEYTDGQWVRLVWSSQAERESLLLVAGKPATTYTLGLAPGDTIRLRQVFGPLTRHDLESLELQLSIDANTAGILYRYRHEVAPRLPVLQTMYATIYKTIYLPSFGLPSNPHIIR